MNFNEKKVYNILNYLMFSGLIIYFLFFIYHSFKVIFFPYQLNCVEGLLLNQVFCILKGQNFYVNNYPYNCSTYPPLLSLITSLLVPIFGKTFAPGRFIGFLSAILISFFIFKLIKDKTNNIKSAFIGSLSFYIPIYVYDWSTIFHPEFLSILFSIIGLYLVYKYENSSKIYLAVLFFVLSFYTKQTRIIAPITSFIYLYFKNRKIVWKFIFLYVITASIIFLYLNKITKSEFILHTIYGNWHPFIDGKIFSTYYDFLQFNSIFLIFSFVYLILNLKEFSIFSLYFILNGIFLVSAGKIGADVNYLIELVVANCILFGLSINEIKNKVNTFIPLAVILQILIFYHIPHRKEMITYTPTYKDIKTGEKLYNYVKNIKGEILSDVDLSLLVLNNKKIYLNALVFRWLPEKLDVLEQKIIMDIYNKKFSLIILNCKIDDKEGYYTPNMLNVIQKKYELVNCLEINYSNNKQHPYFYLYKPRKL